MRPQLLPNEATPQRELAAAHERSAFGPGGVIVLLLAVSVPLAAFVNRTVDNSVLRRDFQGNSYWYSEGQVGQTLQVGLLLAAACTAALALSRLKAGTIVPSAFVKTMGLLFVWNLLAATIRASSLRQVIEASAALLLFWGVAVSPIGDKTLRWVAYLLNVITVSTLAYAYLAPETGIVECREDKCSPLGTLLVGYFPQENFLAILTVLMLPAAANLERRRSVWLSVLLAAVVVVLTGSRAAMVALAFATLVVALLRRRRQRRSSGRSKGSWWVVRLSPLVGLAVSAYVFLTYGGSTLTGRGYIYLAVKDHLSGVQLLYGAGPNVLEDAYRSGTTGFLAFHEHGQFPHILTRVGLIGAALFVVALLTLAALRSHDVRHVTAMAFSAVAAVLFATESVWKIDPRDAGFWAMLLVVGLVATRQREVTEESELSSPLGNVDETTSKSAHR